jgi:hypothetical protein
MPEEVVDQVELDDDLESGFADDVSNELTETPSESEIEVTAEAEQEPEEVTPWYARVTEDQFNELMSKANSVETLQAEHRRAMDQVFGKIGSMKQVLEQRQAETASGAPVEFSSEDFADLANDYPEFAETLTKAMTNAAKKLRGTGTAPSAEPIDIGAIQEQLRVALNEEALEDEHEGWQEFVQTNEFKSWLSTKPADYQSRLIASQNARFIGKGLTECKQWVSDKQKAAQEAQQKAQKQSARFEAAVNPKSASSNAGSKSKGDDDLLDEGFNS